MGAEATETGDTSRLNEVYVHESGSPAAPTVVFVHGGGPGGAMWGEHLNRLLPVRFTAWRRTARGGDRQGSTHSDERLARLAIDRASREARLAASMWLVRCGCRSRSKSDRGAGAVGTRQTPREPVPEGSSMPNLGDGGGLAARGTTLFGPAAYEDPSVSGAVCEGLFSV
jgi:pimeloyl-ACP methyl ester carboxylesterase